MSDVFWKIVAVLWLGFGVFCVWDSVSGLVFSVQEFGWKINNLVVFIVFFGYGIIIVFLSLLDLLKIKTYNSVFLSVSVILSVYTISYLIFGDEGNIIYRVIIPVSLLLLGGLTVLKIFITRYKEENSE